MTKDKWGVWEVTLPDGEEQWARGGLGAGGLGCWRSRSGKAGQRWVQSAKRRGCKSHRAA